MPKKIPAPVPPAETVRYFSKRLLTALEGMLTNPLTVVEAPAGYGKTVAVTEFLRKKPVRMLVTRAREESPESFWPDFCRSLAQEIPDAGDISAALLSLGLPRDYTQTGAALELLRQLSFPEQSFLVFDDCHNLPRSFLDFCESLAVLQGALPNVRVVYVTRHSWTDNRDAAPPQSSQSYLEPQVFTLTAPEIREFYALHGISLSLETEREAQAKTGGWITALSLSHLWYKKHGELDLFPAETADRIRETVYAPLSLEAKELLFALAPMERFTAAQASKVYGSGATEILEELTRKNAFVAFDHIRRFYSPHAIFRQFLLELFNDDKIVLPKRRREIYRACGNVFNEAKELASAIEAWHKAEDFESALAALEENMIRNLVTEKAGMYFTMFKDCPEEILKRHLGASFKYAIAAFSAGAFQAYGTRLAWLSERCAVLSQEAASEPCPEQARLKEAEAAHWLGELHVLLALKEFNDIEAMSRHHKAALGLLKGPTGLYGPDSPWTLGSPSVLFMFYRESGKLADTLRLMRECMPPYYQLTDHHGAGAELLMEAEALYNAGEFDQAREICRAALDVAVRRNQRGNEFCAMFLYMRLALLNGDAGALFGDGVQPGSASVCRQATKYHGTLGHYPGLVADMRGMIARGRNYFLLHTADLCEGWLYAALGLYDTISPWLRVKLGKDSPLYSFARGFFYIVYGRAQILAENYGDVLKDFSDELKEGNFSKNLLFSVYAHIYLAAALHKTGMRKKAVETLKIALDIALPDALYMPFAENHDLIGPLLAKALSGKEHEKALPRIEALAKRMQESRESVLKTMQAQELATGGSGADQQAGESELKKFAAFTSHHDFTDREMEVFSYILRKLSVKKMAESMGVSDSAVEKHLANILKKTEVARQRYLRQVYAAWKV